MFLRLLLLCNCKQKFSFSYYIMQIQVIQMEIFCQIVIKMDLWRRNRCRQRSPMVLRCIFWIYIFSIYLLSTWNVIYLFFIFGIIFIILKEATSLLMIFPPICSSVLQVDIYFNCCRHCSNRYGWNTSIFFWISWLGFQS